MNSPSKKPLPLEPYGMRVGKLLILARVPERGKNSKYVCVCDCGAFCTVMRSNIRGHTVSCGCHRRGKTIERNTKHNACNDPQLRPTWNVWHEMMRRCSSPKNSSYYRYGGRGIGITTGCAWSQDAQAYIRR